MREAPPQRFLPGHTAPDEVGDDPLLFAFRKRELLVTEAAELPSVAVIDSHDLDAVRTQYLGLLDTRPCYSAELPIDTAAPAGLVFLDLRMLFGRLDEILHTLAGRAVQTVEWDRTHQFCGACAEPTELSTADRSRACPKCKIPMYPRLSPAMIVCVERGNEILLARSPHFPAGIWSVPAGFVEPGESAEEAVVREVHEETGVIVDQVEYFGSQAWPFPNSLMLGFRAQHKKGEVVIDDHEIEEAGFFPADALPMTFQGTFSISQWLIQDFLKRNGQAR